jgi:hypothetical protein
VVGEIVDLTATLGYYFVSGLRLFLCGGFSEVFKQS